MGRRYYFISVFLILTALLTILSLHLLSFDYQKNPEEENRRLSLTPVDARLHLASNGLFLALSSHLRVFSGRSFTISLKLFNNNNRQIKLDLPKCKCVLSIKDKSGYYDRKALDGLFSVSEPVFPAMLPRRIPSLPAPSVLIFANIGNELMQLDKGSYELEICLSLQDMDGGTYHPVSGPIMVMTSRIGGAR